MVPIVCSESVRELIRTLAYPKFRLDDVDRNELLGDYLPFAEVCDSDSLKSGSVHCRDPYDQVFVDLATASAADLLITGDADLLALKGRVAFRILRPAKARAAVMAGA